MIPHMSTVAALKQAGGDREAARSLIRTSIIAEAERQIGCESLLAGRSLKCVRTDHAGQPYGCANDGSTCICACHDGAS